MIAAVTPHRLLLLQSPPAAFLKALGWRAALSIVNRLTHQVIHQPVPRYSFVLPHKRLRNGRFIFWIAIQQPRLTELPEAVEHDSVGEFLFLTLGAFTSA
jgi:hypothetical protein